MSWEYGLSGLNSGTAGSAAGGEDKGGIISCAFLSGVLRLLRGSVGGAGFSLLSQRLSRRICASSASARKDPMGTLREAATALACRHTSSGTSLTLIVTLAMSNL
jgi:hypothetical protein